MSNQALIAIVRPGAAEENGSGKRPLPDGSVSAPASEIFALAFARGFPLPGTGKLGWVLRADQFKELIRAPKIQLLLHAALRPASSDCRLCGVQRAVINTAHHRNFKMEADSFWLTLTAGRPLMPWSGCRAQRRVASDHHARHEVGSGGACRYLHCALPHPSAPAIASAAFRAPAQRLGDGRRAAS